MRRPSPLTVAVLALAITATAAVLSGLTETQGEFAYSLDDAYIHLAIARNIAEHGCFGTNSSEFVSASSSPLWTLTLAAAFTLFGVQTTLPLLLNAAASFLVLLVADRLLRDARVTATGRAVCLVTVTLATPLPALTLIGMEHTLHALLTLLFLRAATRTLTTSAVPPTALLVLAALLCTTRYEGLFAVAPVAAALLIRRRIALAAAVALAAGVPLLLFGAYAVAHGDHWLPHSLLLKGRTLDFSSAHDAYLSLGGRALNRLLQTKASGVVCLVAAAAWLWRGGARGPRTFAALFACAALLHLQFAGFGQLLRYEAYLVTAGVVTITMLMATSHRRSRSSAATRLAGGGLCALLVISMVARATGTVDASHAMRDRVVEHLRPAELVRDHYPDATVAVHDLGAIAFFTDAHVLDLYGLGSHEPIELLGRPPAEVRAGVAEWLVETGAELALIKVDWEDMADLLPDSWIAVAEWRLPRNVVFGDLRLWMFAPNDAAATRLRRALTAFAPRVPRQVQLTLSPER